MADAIAGVPGSVMFSNEPHDLVPSQEAKKVLCVRRSDKKTMRVDPPAVGDTVGKIQYSNPKPDGSLTDGAYERATLSDDGKELTYAYNDDPDSHADHKSRQHVHIVAWKSGIPVLS